MSTLFSFGRLGALLGKEFIQMRRDRVTFAIEVSVPEPQVVVATGRPDGETRQGGRYAARFVSEHPGEPPSLFAGPYRIVERSGEGPLLRAYLHPELTEDLGRDYLDYSAGIIARFAERIGPYPFSAFHIVSAPLPVGLGFPGMTYIDRLILPLPFIKGQSLAHEILHNWWGNGVVPRTIWSPWAGSTPRRKDSSTVSSNLAFGNLLRTSTAS